MPTRRTLSAVAGTYPHGTSQDNRSVLIIPVQVAGILADVLSWWLKSSVARRRSCALFAVVVLVIFYGCYFLALQLAWGIAWSIHLWLGSLLLAGLVGLGLSFIVGTGR